MTKGLKDEIIDQIRLVKSSHGLRKQKSKRKSRKIKEIKTKPSELAIASPNGEPGEPTSAVDPSPSPLPTPGYTPSS